MRGFALSRRMLGTATVAFVLGLSVSGLACGGDDEPSETGTSGQTRPGTSTSTEGSGSGQERAGSPTDPGADGERGSASDGATGGSRAPRAGAAPRRKSLLRFLATRYGQSPWYPLLRRLTVNGGHVTVYLTFSPESDDEGPPVLACTAVLSYGRQVREVTVYGSPTSQGRTAILKEC